MSVGRVHRGYGRELVEKYTPVSFEDWTWPVKTRPCPVTNTMCTCYFQKCLDARVVPESKHFRNLPVCIVYLTP